MDSCNIQSISTFTTRGFRVWSNFDIWTCGQVKPGFEPLTLQSMDDKMQSDAEVEKDFGL